MLRSSCLAMAIAAFLIFMPGLAAATSAENIVFGDHPEYYDCKTNDDCMAVKGLCEEWRAVNRDNEKKLVDAINYLSVAFICKEYASRRNKPSAACSMDQVCHLGE